MNSRTFPGDDIVPEPSASSTYSIEINAEPSAIWPWIVQMGYHRGGWYIDAWWDKFIMEKFWPLVVPKEARPEYRPPADKIIPDLQDLNLGDIILDGPPGSAFYTVVGLEPNRLLLLHSTSHFKYMLPNFTTGTRFEPRGDWTWAFILDEINDHTTRCTIRFRAVGNPWLILTILKPVILIADYFHVRQMLKGVKRRVEGAQQ